MIHDNLIIAYEAFHYLKKNQCHRGRGVALKLDMNKAYDRVNWDFLKKVLVAYGFDMSWVESVMALVTSISYSYQVNGFSSNKIFPKRGLRHGDPLSPYLFIKVFDVLSRLITDAHTNLSFHGIKLAESTPSHSLIFADDSILFSRDSQEDMYRLI